MKKIDTPKKESTVDFGKVGGHLDVLKGRLRAADEAQVEEVRQMKESYAPFRRALVQALAEWNTLEPQALRLISEIKSYLLDSDRAGQEMRLSIMNLRDDSTQLERTAGSLRVGLVNDIAAIDNITLQTIRSGALPSRSASKAANLGYVRKMMKKIELELEAGARRAAEAREEAAQGVVIPDFPESPSQGRVLTNIEQS